MESPLCPAGTRLIETFCWDGSTFIRLDRHLARASASAAALGFDFDQNAIAAALEQIISPTPLRVRLTLGKSGDAEVTTATLATTQAQWRLILAQERLTSTDPLLHHKTTQRGQYDRARATLPEGLDEVIFANERGEICEGTITTVFFDLGQGMATPPLASGCLPGVLRAELLENGTCREAILHMEDLARAKLWLGNSLRGLIPALPL